MNNKMENCGTQELRKVASSAATSNSTEIGSQGHAYLMEFGWNYVVRRLSSIQDYYYFYFQMKRKL